MCLVEIVNQMKLGGNNMIIAWPITNLSILNQSLSIAKRNGNKERINAIEYVIENKKIYYPLVEKHLKRYK